MGPREVIRIWTCLDIEGSECAISGFTAFFGLIYGHVGTKNRLVIIGFRTVMDLLIVKRINLTIKTGTLESVGG